MEARIKNSRAIVDKLSPNRPRRHAAEQCGRTVGLTLSAPDGPSGIPHTTLCTPNYVTKVGPTTIPDKGGASQPAHRDIKILGASDEKEDTEVYS